MEKKVQTQKNYVSNSLLTYVLRYNGYKGKEGRQARKRGGREAGWLYALQTGNMHAVLYPLEISFLSDACVEQHRNRSIDKITIGIY